MRALVWIVEDTWEATVAEAAALLPADAEVAILHVAPAEVEELAGGARHGLLGRRPPPPHAPLRAVSDEEAAAEQPHAPGGGNRLDVGVEHAQQRDVRVGGQQRGGLVDAGLPTALGCPHDGAHQTTCRANHNRTVPATSAGGTVSAPRRTNSPRSVVSSWACTTRRQSSVASEPT